MLGIVVLASYFSYRHFSTSSPDANTASHGATSSSLPGINPPGEGKVWVCPMHPEIMQNHPGTCPICGMDLVESRNPAAIHDHGIHVDSASIQKLGVRLASVSMSPISQDIRAYGTVTVDESTLHTIHSKVDGWIQKSHIHSVGQHIKQGQVIYEIYSPELITQQKEFLRFMERRNQILKTIGDVRMQENEYVMNLLAELSKERSKFLHEDVDLETVQKIEDSRMPVDVVKIVAARSGVVTQINAREGSYATPSASLFTLADVSRAWVVITLYPDQADQVSTGDEVTITGADRQTVKAKLDFLSPVADNNKVIARAAIDNSRLRLRPGSFADVTIHAQPREALVVPRSAVLRSGRGDVVILSRGDGHFLPVHVETGIESGEWIEITGGIQPGAEVAVNGQFLLDSASSLSAAVERMKSQVQMEPGQQDAK